MLIVILLAPFQLKAAGSNAIVVAIRHNKDKLYYPLEVAHFYKQNGYQLAWIAPDTVKTHVWDAMMLLDCIKQYGLNHDDYHPNLLLYEKLHLLIAQKGTVAETANFDVLLTDAIIRFINDLHYGKLNPVYTADRIDHGKNFKAEKELSADLLSANFRDSVTKVQPKSHLYIALQDHMRLLVGQRSGDCFAIPPELIRKMAINMERIRWVSTTRLKVHFTCIVYKGEVINYKDIYNKDLELERILYNEIQPLKRFIYFSKEKPQNKF